MDKAYQEQTRKTGSSEQKNDVNADLSLHSARLQSPRSSVVLLSKNSTFVIKQPDIVVATLGVCGR